MGWRCRKLQPAPLEFPLTRGIFHTAPPPGPAHRYRFTLYALDSRLDVPAGVTKADLQMAMRDHVLAQAELVGRYQRRARGRAEGRSV
jgi:phosphatidylethanolamine-binding protein (PEBP) family uncharacterized protein